jgi:hypothetical protein
MSGSLIGRIEQLKQFETMPLLPHLHSAEISEVMMSLLDSGHPLDALIRDFGASRSFAVASACCITVSLTLKKERPLFAYRSLSTLASRVVFRFNYSIVTTMLSTACYCGAAIERIAENDRMPIILLCEFGLDFAEGQASGGQADLARGKEILELVDILLELMCEKGPRVEEQKVIARVRRVGLMLSLGAG